MGIPQVLLPVGHTQLAERRWALDTWCGCGLYSVSSISPRHSAPARNRPAQQARPGTRSSAQAVTGRDPLPARPHRRLHRLHRQRVRAAPCLPPPRRPELRCPRPFLPPILGLVSAHGPAFTSLNPLLFLLRLPALTWAPALKYY